MKQIRLTRRAETRLREIAGWTIDRYGPTQARKYEENLVHRLRALAVGEAPHGKSCGALVSGVPGADSLQYYREGGHYIIFRETADALIVIDFVHGARDLEGILADLARAAARG